MPWRFWDELASHGDAIALIDGESGEQWTYRVLADAVAAGARHLFSARKKVIFLAADHDIGSILCYLRGLRAGHAVFLCNGRSGTSWNGQLLDRYCPDIVIWKAAESGCLSHRRYRLIDPLFGYSAARTASYTDGIDAQLALLLSTSGSTGSSKLVRLSASNVAVGAEQVVGALGIRQGERAITNLPISFVYGLTVLHSHLAAGASLVVTHRSGLDHAFWSACRKFHVTNLAGVPWSYKTLRQIAFERMECPSLQKMTHSGGRLDEVTRRWLVDTFPRRGVDIYFMYGQTEAGGRISVLSPSLARAKSESVGSAVPYGRIICGPDGEVVYDGPNVMQGYAMCRDDLGRGDDLRGTLHTGDLGFLDRDGQLYLTGRASRFCKLLGLRINLDDIEAQLGEAGQVAAVSDDAKLYIFVEHDLLRDLPQRITRLTKQLGVPPSLIVACKMAPLPRAPNGKIRYGALAWLITEASKDRVSQDSPLA